MRSLRGKEGKTSGARMFFKPMFKVAKKQNVATQDATSLDARLTYVC